MMPLTIPPMPRFPWFCYTSRNYPVFICPFPPLVLSSTLIINTRAFSFDSKEGEGLFVIDGWIRGFSLAILYFSFAVLLFFFAFWGERRRRWWASWTSGHGECGLFLRLGLCRFPGPLPSVSIWRGQGKGWRDGFDKDHCIASSPWTCRHDGHSFGQKFP